MDDEQRAEIFRIQTEQRALRAQLEALETRVALLVRPAPLVEQPAAIAPAEPPPLPGLPPVVEQAPISESGLAELRPPPLPTAAPPPPKESLEVQFGAKWFVRVAIFMLVAALAFLANYLYQTVIPHLGPAAKVGLLYLGAGGFTALGLWLERGREARTNAGLLDYAQIVLAGGLAAVYYVTYAAHNYEPLRVIGSPLLAGLLLLGWTAFMAWLADRRNSEALAGFSILLAYFTSATSEVAGFALVANLGLTAAAVYLVLRRRWTAFSFASLAATFGSYAYWRYGGDPSMGVGRAGLWMEGLFLACYWGLFTLAAFVDRQETLAGQGRRATFVSLNNGAFFALVGLLVRAEYPGEFWKWCLALGALLLALGELGRRLPKPLDPPSVDSYYFGGISLVTLGLILYFSGWQLSLILAVESATVLGASGRRESRPLFFAAGVVGMIAAGMALWQLQDARALSGWSPASFCGAVLLFNAWQCRWTHKERSKDGEALYSLLGLLVWFALLQFKITQDGWRGPILAGVTVALTALFLPLRIPAAICLVQGYLLAAHAQWIVIYGLSPAASAPPIWNPAVILIATVGLATGWEWLRRRPAYSAIPKWVGVPYEATEFLLYAVAAGKYFHGSGLFTAYVFGSFAALGLAWVGRAPRQRWWSLALAVCGAVLYVFSPGAGSIRYLPGILLLAGEQQFARRLGRSRGISSPRWEGAVVSLAALCGWRWVDDLLGGAGWGAFTVSAGWSLYGGVLFALGILARERGYRWWGLGVIGAAFAHVLIVDIWQLGNFERFISFFAISLILLAIGFIYNRFPSKVREWL